MVRLSWLTALTLTAFIAVACSSTHEEGVKSNLRKQWVDVAAGTEKTTEAAKAVLEAEGLRDVKATGTNLDGQASAKMADGTKINVEITKKSENISQVSVVVGTMGGPGRGAEIASKIKAKAEGGN
jgi:hypothetical protein